MKCTNKCPNVLRPIFAYHQSYVAVTSITMPLDSPVLKSSFHSLPKRTPAQCKYSDFPVQVQTRGKPLSFSKAIMVYTQLFLIIFIKLVTISLVVVPGFGEYPYKVV